MTTADSALDALASIDQHALRSEITYLRAVHDAALRSLNLDFQPGDRVAITSAGPSNTGGGWHHYREALAPGQTGIAGPITYNPHVDRWQCLVGMDRAWSVHEQDRWPLETEVTRYWYGPAPETPDGYTPPSTYDQEKHPAGTTKHFAISVHSLAKAPSSAPGPVPTPTAETSGCDADTGRPVAPAVDLEPTDPTGDAR